MRRGAPTRRPSLGAKGRPDELEQAAVGAWVRVLAVHRRGLAVIRDHLERDMTLSRFDLLSNLMREDGQTCASLSRSMLVTAGNLTGLVDRAARDGMVERRADPTDRRAWRVHATPKGQKIFREAERRHALRVAKIFGNFTPTELSTLTRLLDKMRHGLKPAASDGQNRPTTRPPGRAAPSHSKDAKRRRRS